MVLPTLALIYGGENGWRYALATTGVIAGLYGISTIVLHEIP